MDCPFVVVRLDKILSQPVLTTQGVVDGHRDRHVIRLGVGVSKSLDIRNLLTRVKVHSTRFNARQYTGSRGRRARGFGWDIAHGQSNTLWFRRIGLRRLVRSEEHTSELQSR